MQNTDKASWLTSTFIAGSVYLILNLVSPPTRTLVNEEPTLYDPENIKDPDAADFEDAMPEEKGQHEAENTQK